MFWIMIYPKNAHSEQRVMKFRLYNKEKFVKSINLIGNVSPHVLDVLRQLFVVESYELPIQAVRHIHSSNTPIFVPVQHLRDFVRIFELLPTTFGSKPIIIWDPEEKVELNPAIAHAMVVHCIEDLAELSKLLRCERHHLLLKEVRMLNLTSLNRLQSFPSSVPYTEWPLSEMLIKHMRLCEMCRNIAQEMLTALWIEFCVKQRCLTAEQVEAFNQGLTTKEILDHVQTCPNCKTMTSMQLSGNWVSV